MLEKHSDTSHSIYVTYRNNSFNFVVVWDQDEDDFYLSGDVLSSNDHYVEKIQLAIDDQSQLYLDMIDLFNSQDCKDLAQDCKDLAQI